jgi:acetyl-CoA carboxylase biotin carboxyl carrier protein
MEISYIKKIIKLVENSDIDEIEVEEEGKKLRVARNRNSAMAQQVMIPQHAISMPPASTPAHQESKPQKELSESSDKQYHELRSPIVGTFYRAPSPDAETYVEIGQHVKVGSVLCIVEAMKLMNEIESDAEGTIVKIMIENGKPVEYNQVLFLIEK